MFFHSPQRSAPVEEGRSRKESATTDRTEAMATRRSTKRAERPAEPALTAAFSRESTRDEESRERLGGYGDGADTEYEGLPTPARHDDELPMLVDDLPPGEGEEVDDEHAPDDALGLYLRQMGAIPLLTRPQELALAVQLETQRWRYRHATLSCRRTLMRVVETFERV